MNITDLQKCIDSGMSQREIAAALDCSQINVRYWLGKYNLATIATNEVKPHLCKICGETDPKSFYTRRKIRCKSCENIDALERGRSMRNKALNHLGGKCIACGFDKWNCSLAIHHRGAKDPNFKTMKYWKWDRVKKELENCVILCHNCHSGHHSGYVPLD